MDVLADSFVMIGPDGRSSNVEQVRAFVEAAYGRRPTGFEIRNIAVRPPRRSGPTRSGRPSTAWRRGGSQRP